MTNRDMIKPDAAARPGTAPAPNCDASPPVPAPEDSPRPIAAQEPEDSPHPQPPFVTQRAGGLTTRKD